MVCVPSKVAPVKADRIPALEKGLLHRGFLGSRNSFPSLPAMKEASSSVKGAKIVVEESQVCSSSKKHVAELGLRLGEPFPRMSEGGAPIYSSISKSQIGYTRRVKEKIAQQLHKNKELFAEVVEETVEKGVENYLEVVQDAVKFASIMRLFCDEGGVKKSHLNLFSNIVVQFHDFWLTAARYTPYCPLGRFYKTRSTPLLLAAPPLNFSVILHSVSPVPPL